MIISRSEVAVGSPRATLPNSTAPRQSGKCVVTNARAASWPSIFIEEIFGSIEALSECLDLIDLVLAQPEIHGADDARDLLRAPHADDCACNHAVSQSPGDRGLARVAVVARGDL